MSETRAALERAATACAARDFEGALRAAIEAWQRRPDERIAAAIDRIDAAFLTPRDAVPAMSTTAASFEAVEEAARARDVTPLVDFVNSRTGTQPGAAALIPQLAERRGRDPRLASALIELVRKPPYYRKAPGLYEAVFKQLVAIGDPRTVDEIVDLSAAYRGKRTVVPFLGKRGMPFLHAAADKLAAVLAPPPDEALAGLCDEIERRLGGRGPGRDDSGLLEMLEEIHDNPTDMQLRQVYADMLTEAGDPRGEFIVLQCARVGTDERPTPRERQLQKTHGRLWLGALEPVANKGGVEFRGGFVSALRYQNMTVGVDVVGAREWSTVETLSVNSWGGEVSRVLLHPVMGQLRSVTSMGYRTLHEILVHPEPLPWTHLQPKLLLDRFVDAIVNVGPLAHLESLDAGAYRTDLSALRMLIDSRLGAQLRRVRVQVEPSAWGSALEIAASAGERLEALEIVGFCDNDGHRGWLVTIERSATGRFDQLHAAYGRKRRATPAMTIKAGLQSIPAGALSQIVVRAPTRVRNADPSHEATIIAATARFEGAAVTVG